MERKTSPAVLIVALGAVVFGGWLTTLYPEPPWIPVRAEVARISTEISKDHRTEIVLLRTATGIGEARFTDSIARCQVGDVVDAEQSGVAIRRAPTTCL